MRLFWIVISLSLITACASSTSEEKTKKKYEIELFVSRSGSSYKYKSGTDPLPNVSDEIYHFDLDTLGNLKSLLAYGNSTRRDMIITINGDHIKETRLNSSQLEAVRKLASKIDMNDGFSKMDRTEDGWFIKLVVNKKVFIYNLGDAVDTPELNEDFSSIVKKIVKCSKYEVEDWKWY